jgi:DNA-binding CsgD family transcriptional regulator
MPRGVLRLIQDVQHAQFSPRLALQAASAEALGAPDELAANLFEAALDIPGIDRWPFEMAQVQLAFGERLRRQQATRASREQLAAALDTFTRLGARPWAERANAELRATGQTRHRAVDSSPRPLTPQELGIAELAATGLTNKQIGARLYLSPRTVSAHLYRVFPKLGIASRAALRDALLALPAGADRQVSEDCR